MFAAEAAETAVPWLYENAWLIPALPAASFLLILFFGKRLPFKGAEIGIAAVGAAFVLAVLTSFTWIGDIEGAEAEPAADHSEEGDHSEEEGGLIIDGESAAASLLFVEEGDGHGGERGNAVVTDTRWFGSGGIDFKIGTLIDGQSVMLLFVVTFISLLVHIYSTDYVNGDRRYTHYFAFLSLFTAAMLFMVLSSSTLQLIVGWELVGVCSFALIGHWWEEKPNSDAALKAFLTNRVGDIGLLIGIIVLYFGAGQTFNILEINEKAVAGEIDGTLLTVAAVCLMAAVMSKSGQFILHTWLPDAMAGPTPVSALIHAATMVVAGVYMIGRLYAVFWEGLSIGGSNINLMAFIGGLTTVGGGALAFVQRDIKKVLAYSTVSQLGYMVLALGMGAYTAGMFHLFTHAFFKACLFLGAGSVSHACHHSFDMKADMGGLRKYMPKTFWTFIIGSAALAGIPPLAGFWSKDEILAGAGVWPGTDGNGDYMIPFIFGMITAAMTAAYMTRTVWLTFFGEYRGHDHPHESGNRITVPLIILAGMASVVGFLNLPGPFVETLGLPSGWAHRFEDWVEPAGVPHFPAISHANPSLEFGDRGHPSRHRSRVRGLPLLPTALREGPEGVGVHRRDPIEERVGCSRVQRARQQVLPRSPLLRHHRRRHEGPARSGRLLVQPERDRWDRQYGWSLLGDRRPVHLSIHRSGCRRWNRERLWSDGKRVRPVPSKDPDWPDPPVRNPDVRRRSSARRRVHLRRMSYCPATSTSRYRFSPATRSAHL